MEDKNIKGKLSGLTEEQAQALMARIVELEGQIKTLKEIKTPVVEQKVEQSPTHQCTPKCEPVGDEKFKRVHFDRISDQDEFYEKVEKLSDVTEMVTFSSLGEGVFVDLVGCAAINTLEKSAAVAKANDGALKFVDFVFGISSNEDYFSDDFVKLFGRLKNKINVIAVGDKLTRVYSYYNHEGTFSFACQWGSHKEMEEFIEDMMEEIECDEEETPTITPEEMFPYSDDEPDEDGCDCHCCCCGCCDEPETTNKVSKDELDDLVKEVRMAANGDEHLMLIILRKLFGLKV